MGPFIASSPTRPDPTKTPPSLLAEIARQRHEGQRRIAAALARSGALRPGLRERVRRRHRPRPCLSRGVRLARLRPGLERGALREVVEVDPHRPASSMKTSCARASAPLGGFVPHRSTRFAPRGRGAPRSGGARRRCSQGESGPDEGPLRGDVVQSRVGDHPGQSVVGGHGQQGDDRLRGIAVAAGRGGQAVADLDAAAIRLALEADPPDRPPVGQAGDPVVAERPLLAGAAVARRKPPTAPTSPSKGKSSAQASAGPALRATIRSASATSIACSCRRDVRTSVMASAKQPPPPSTEFRRPGGQRTGSRSTSIRPPLSRPTPVASWPPAGAGR